jgi:carboxylesterase
MESLPFARFFQGPEHQAFTLAGGAPGALLVHGFPGTPSEMLPLARTLNQVGWTVHGLLLPGFGPQIETLAQRTSEEWAGAVLSALQHLHQEHKPILVGGFSMGAALALQAAAVVPVDGVILLAPYWKLRGFIWSLLPLIRRLFPTIRPFRLVKMDFTDPEMRKGMGKFMPDIDLDDPDVQRGIRNFTLPVGMFDEVRKAGLGAGRAAPQIHAPTIIIQGRQDELVRVEVTRQLLARVLGPLSYHEVTAAHDLPDPSKPGWLAVQSAVLQFARQIEEAT